MADLESLVVKLEADLSSFKSEMLAGQRAVAKSSSSIEQSLRDMSEKGAKSAGNLGRILDTALGVGLANLATGAMALAGRGAKALFNILVTDGVTAAQENEQAITKLNTQLALSGEYSLAASKDMQAFADGIEYQTGVAAEAVMENIALAKSFGFTNDAAKKVTEAALEFGSAANISFTEALRRIGRSASGSTEDISKFAPEIKNLTAEQLRAGAAADVLLAKFSGTAAAQMQTFGGAVTNVGNQFGKLPEEFAKTVTGNSAVVGAINESAKIFDELSNEVTENGDSLKVFVAEGLQSVISGAQMMVAGLDAGVRAVESLFGIMTASTKVLTGAVAGVVQVLNGDFAGGWEALKAGAEDAAKGIVEPFTKTTVLDRVGGTLARIGDAARTAAGGQDELNRRLASQSEAAAAARASVVQLNETQKLRLDQGIKLEEQLAASHEMELVRMEQLAEMRGIELETIAGQHAIKLEMLNARILSEQQALDLAREQDKISEKAYQDAVLALRKKASIEGKKLDEERFEKEQQLNAQRLQATSSVFGNIQTIASAFGKEGFEIRKRAAQAQAIVDGIVATQRALSAAPPPFNIILAATTAAAAAANVAKIQQTKLAGGIDSVPGIGTQDNFPAILAPRERVVPAETNRDLTQFLREQRAGSNQQPIQINVTINGHLGMSQEQLGLSLIEALNAAKFQLGAAPA